MITAVRQPWVPPYAGVGTTWAAIPDLPRDSGLRPHDDSLSEDPPVDEELLHGTVVSRGDSGLERNLVVQKRRLAKRAPLLVQVVEGLGNSPVPQPANAVSAHLNPARLRVNPQPCEGLKNLARRSRIDIKRPRV